MADCDTIAMLSMCTVFNIHVKAFYKLPAIDQVYRR